MGKFKIGDRVRLTDDCEMEAYGLSAGDEGIVLENSAAPFIKWDRPTKYNWAAAEDELELVTPALTLTTGKIYRTASGAVTSRVTKGDTGFEAIIDGKVRIFDAAGGAVFGGDDIVEEWVPKVGERVRFAQNNPNGGSHYGAAGEVVEVASAVEKNPHYGDQVDIIHPAHSWKPSAPVSALEPLPVAAPAQTAAALKIEAGRYYRTRDGRKVGPMEPAKYTDGWYDAATRVTSQRWEKDGTFIPGELSSLDIIAEWHDTPSAPVAAQVDTISEEYGGGKREPRPWDRYSARVEANDNTPKTADVTVSISLDTGNMHEELDELIAKLKKIKKLQRQVGLAA